MLRSLTAGVALAAASAVCFAACSTAHPGGPVAISLASARSAVVTGLSSEETDALSAAKLSTADMQRVLRVRVAGADVPVSGSYAISNSRIEFTPTFPFDAGRAYTIDFVRDAMPVRQSGGTVTTTLSLPAADLTPVTRVTGIHPTAELWPANVLRAYISFSSAMGNDSGVGHITLHDDRGTEVSDAFLPLESDFWNADHTRYTVFFDPGRVKRGILPNRQQGRALVAGRRYAIEVDAIWRDAGGRPLVERFRREFRVGPAIDAPMSVADWTIAAPTAGSRSPLVVVFLWPIDHALSQRALLVVGPVGRSVAGDSDLAQGDVRWSFTPRENWTAGEYRLDALPILEDPSGNQVGRAFEVDMRRAPASPPDTPRARTFRIR